jgi:hypothetical protein
LSTVKAALNDQDEAIQDEAVNLLSTWPNTWPEDAGVAEPLLALVKSGKKVSYQVQGLQGYLQFIEQDKKLGQGEKLAKLKDLLPLTKRPDEKRQVVAVIGTLPTAGALELLTSLVRDEGVSEEASVAALKLATAKKLEDDSKELRRNALATIVEKAQNDSTRNKASEALKKLD